MDRGIKLTVVLAFIGLSLGSLSAAPTVNTTAGKDLSPSSPTESTDSPLANEETLFKDLFDNYNKNLRPNYNTSNEPLQVELGLAVRRIEYLDEKRQTLLFHGTTRLRWMDKRLAWDQQDYEQIANIAYPSYALWVPDIRLQNQAAQLGVKTFEHGLANIYSDGQVYLSTQSAFTVYCGMDFGKWPYDVQSCTIEFESFTMDGTRVDLRMMGQNSTVAVETSPYASLNEWHVLGMVALKNVKRYECCPGEFHSIYFTIRLQRNQPFYRPLLLTPMIVMVFASWLLFLLPLQSCMKFVIGAIELVFVASFALFLKSYLPPSIEEIPYIVTLNLNTMVLVLLALFIQSALLFMSRLKCAMPHALKTLFLDGLGRACCLKLPNGYTKSNLGLQLTAEGQEVDHFEMSDSSDALTSEKTRHEWATLASVLNRVCFTIHVVVCLIVLL
ncbi:putative Neuronal acetylcholine receptor subunit alpha-10 [Hypsibius exemplaris]|uniref:Neuronal acetylcholine receptor subunit alpha-10 n=1 Tax=Hypsibius exemplaris TaxID=2072580 RepID=A0A1W0WMC6_HYPEX|nr:putative Neuronal acetylcholine receptor subunit alpha-10 [Hypsibius exemplaris]